MRILEDRRPEKPEVVVEETRYVESDTKLMQRLLGREVGGKQNILVLNDEAHHAYRIRQEATETPRRTRSGSTRSAPTSSRYESTVWIDGLDRIHKHRRINFCVDLSATPYYLARAGEDTNRIFPWVVSDFGLTDAIESGLVKIPQLAHSDPTGEEQAAYFNIWRWIMSKLTARRARRQASEPEAGGGAASRRSTRSGCSRSPGRSCARSGTRRRRASARRCFILVCKNTKLAGVDLRLARRGQGAGRASRPPTSPSCGTTTASAYTIRVDSKVVAETEVEGAKNDESRWMRFTLDTVGKRDWPRDDQGRPVYPEGFEELAKKLDRPLHPPGRDVRCIVSVGMLTEGWDCNTVTHIVGLRPFMSQLLCEQVVGRGLRRASYDLNEDGQVRRGGREDPRRAVRGGAVQAAHGAAAATAAAAPRPGAPGEGASTRSRSRGSRATSRRSATGSRSTGTRSRPSSVDPMKIPDEVRLKATLLEQGPPVASPSRAARRR